MDSSRLQKLLRDLISSSMLPTSLSRRMTSAIKTSHLLRSSTTRYCPLKCTKRDSSSLLSPFISLLQPSHSTIIQDEQNMLSSLLKSLRAIDAPQNDFDLVYDTRSRIDDLFLIVIVGEFNSGLSVTYILSFVICVYHDYSIVSFSHINNNRYILML